MIIEAQRIGQPDVTFHGIQHVSSGEEPRIISVRVRESDWTTCIRIAPDAIAWRDPQAHHILRIGTSEDYRAALPPLAEPQEPEIDDDCDSTFTTEEAHTSLLAQMGERMD